MGGCRAEVVIEKLARHYNTVRRYASLGYRHPPRR
jgi:hypothetical protein